MSDKEADYPVLFSEEQIRSRIDELARQISCDYLGSDLLVIGILNGSFIFLADLVREISVPLKIDFISLSSYGQAIQSSGMVDMRLDIHCDVLNYDVLIVEDIIDTGYTIQKSRIIDRLLQKGAKSVKICTLLNKKDRRKVDIKLDYIGFVIPNEFVIGYGMDYAGLYRNLPYIAIMKAE